jgi:hypothetical protein
VIFEHNMKRSRSPTAVDDNPKPAKSHKTENDNKHRIGYACPKMRADGTICGKTAFTKSNLGKHIRQVHRDPGNPPEHVCQRLLDDSRTCGKAFFQSQDLKRHESAVHDKLRPFVCQKILEGGQICGKAASTKGNLDKHIRAIHKEPNAVGSHVCARLLDDQTVCGKTFFEAIDLRKHEGRVHDKHRPEVCLEQVEDGKSCGQTFYSKHELRLHVANRHVCELKHSCDRIMTSGEPCTKAYKTKMVLLSHIRACHTKSHECSRIYEDGAICRRTFSGKSSLNRHIAAVHDKIRNYICDRKDALDQKCGRAFGKQGALDRHIKGVHDKIRDHECQHVEAGLRCAYRGCTPGDLVKHVKNNHTKEGIARRRKTEAWVGRELKKAGIVTDTEVKIEYSCFNTDGRYARIDHVVIARTDVIVLLEVDEHQHRDRMVGCETRRMADVITALRCAGKSEPILWVRFNPHAYSVGGSPKLVLQKDKMATLVDFLQHYQPKQSAEIAYLYYSTRQGMPLVCSHVDYPSEMKKLVKYVKT